MRGNASLLETLKVIESNIPEETQLLISYIKTKINKEGKITDGETSQKVTMLIDALVRLVGGSSVNNLHPEG
ncbi:MAG: hypothetical protein SGI96_04280 [Bacteroidota bacterium]|nr:hypothetical protein [Bacteroidota bacterium]